MRSILFTIGLFAAGIAADGLAGTGPALNDSGQSTCYDGNSAEPCDPHGYPGQDGRHGRDAAAADGVLDKTGAGAEGFDFSKIARDGTELPSSAQPGPGPGDWACIRDNTTGLLWTLATPSANWADATDVLAADANTDELCGFDDWRLPATGELQGLLHYGAIAPRIDGDYFPDTPTEQHWAAETRVSLTSQAWVVNFDNGRVEFLIKTNSRPVRLVAGTAPAVDFQDNGDGTVTDTRTGIVWDRCSLGQSWNDGTCDGDADSIGWQAALQAVQALNADNHLGHDDWRLPNAKELGSLVDRGHNNPAIDPSVFPATPTNLAWTSTSQSDSFLHKWVVDFAAGGIRAHNGSLAVVRLARGGHGLDGYDRLRYTVGGTVTGLTTAGLVLRLNGANDLPVDGDGGFVMPTRLADGASYAVTVQAQPDGRTCTIDSGNGVIDGADVDDIEITCASAVTYTVTPIVAVGEGSIAPADDQPVDGGHRFDFTVTPEPGWRIEAVAGSCGGLLSGDVYRTEPVFEDCTVIASFSEGTAPVQPLNDSGQNFCYDEDNAIQACEPAEVPGQDGRYGRDPAFDAGVLPKLDAGVEGFDIRKLADDGGVLPPGAGTGDGWTCNHDNVTGLAWTLVAPVVPWDDAEALAADANAATLCGHDDWRLPRVPELQGLVHYGLPAGPMIDTGYFPGTAAAEYWTADERSDNPAQAWTVSFDNGTTITRAKNQQRATRLVRGAPLTHDFVDHGDGTVSSVDTGLMWDRCEASQSWTGSTCSEGSPSGTGWLPALAVVQQRNAANHLGYSDWRLPNVKELASIVDPTLRDPALDTTIFPDPPPFAQYMSATTSTGTPNTIYTINAALDGAVRTLAKNGLNRIRMVRGGTAYAGYDRLLRSIGGTVAGLSEGEIVLQLNGDETLTLDQNGPFAFATRLTEGQSYSVVMLSQPDEQVCIVANATGTVGDDDLTTIAVTCGIAGMSWIVTPSVNGGGDIDPGIEQLVDQGDQVVFTLTPDPGWQLAGVAGSCGGVLSGATYTTNAIVADCTVEASFAVSGYLVTGNVADGGGDIVPPQQVAQHGDTVSFAVVADPGFQIESVNGCGGSLTGSTYVTGPVTDACQVTASFRAPATVASITGTPQSTAAGTTFAEPLRVQVRYADDSPAAEVAVRFTAPASGAGASFGDGATSVTVITDAQGEADVEASANGAAGDYVVLAEVDGTAAPAQFLLTNLASADLAIAIDDGRGHARYGTTLNYLVMAHNSGPSDVADAAIDNDFPPELDIDNAHWLCLGGNGVSCTAQGQGALVDVDVSIPAQGSAAWLLSAPIRIDAGAEVDNVVGITSVDDGHPDNDSASDHTWLVLLRDGFEYPNGAPAALDPASAPSPDLALLDQPLAIDDIVLMTLPVEPPAGLIDSPLTGTAEAGGGFRLERLGYNQRQWLRLVVAGAGDGERISAWLPIDTGARIALALTEAGDDLHLMLFQDHAGTGSNLSMPVQAPPSYRLRLAEGVRIDLP